MAYNAHVMFLVDICIGLPLTILLLVLSCRAIQRGQVPVIYYTNLLVATILQLFSTIALVANPDQLQYNSVPVSCYAFSMMANLSFKLCICLEGSSVIIFRQLDFIRQAKISVLACVLIWVICILTVSLATLKEFTISVLAIIHAPVYLLCLAGTLKCLPAATTVPAEKKRRIVGALVLLVLSYFVLIVPMIILSFHNKSNMPGERSLDVIVTLFLLSPFVDLILFVFMCDLSTDILMAGLCCCIKKDSATPTV